MCTAAEVSGAASVSPTMPNSAPPPIVTISTASGLRLSVAPNTNGCSMFCSSPLASRTITPRISASVGPSEPSARTNAKMPAVHAPMYGT